MPERMRMELAELAHETEHEKLLVSPRPHLETFSAGDGHGFGGQETSKCGQRINKRTTPDDRTRLQHGVATDLGMVANERAEFAQPGFENLAVGKADANALLVQPEIRQDDSGRQMRVIAEDRVAHVVEVRDLNLVHEHAILELTRVPQDTSFADDDVAANERAGSDFSVCPDPRRPLNGAHMGQDHAGMEKHILVDMNRVRNVAARGSELHPVERFPDLRNPLPRRRIGQKVRGKLSQTFGQGKKFRGAHGSKLGFPAAVLKPGVIQIVLKAALVSPAPLDESRATSQSHDYSTAAKTSDAFVPPKP